MIFQNKEKQKDERLRQLTGIKNKDTLVALLAHNKSEIVHLYSEMGKNHSFLYVIWCKNRIEELEWENKEIETML